MFLSSSLNTPSKPIKTSWDAAEKLLRLFSKELQLPLFEELCEKMYPYNLRECSLSEKVREVTPDLTGNIQIKLLPDCHDFQGKNEFFFRTYTLRDHNSASKY